MNFFRGQLLCLMTLLLTLMSGCTSYPSLTKNPNPEDQLLAELRNRVQQRFPESCGSLQIVQISIGGKQYDFTGYLRLYSDKEYDAVAINEMGLTIFEFTRRGQEKSVISKPPGMNDALLQSGPMEDINFLFGTPKGDPSSLLQSNSVISLVYDAGKGERVEFQFSSDTHELIGCRDIRNGKCVREVSYEDMHTFSGLDYEIPRKIILVQHDLFYQMEILVHSIDTDL